MIRSASIRDTTGYALARVCKAHRATVSGLLSDIGLHAGQEMVLMQLWEKDGLRGGELAARLRVEPPTVTKMLYRLEKCGLVERRRNPGDARSFMVYLTDEGRALREPVTSIWREAEERTFSGLSAGERKTFHRILEKIRGNLDPDVTTR